MKRAPLYKVASTNFSERPSVTGLKRYCRYKILLLVVVCAVTIPPHFRADQFTLGINSAAAADISYIYDDLGRLKAVVDPGSDTAVYNYDSVGNLLSISRQVSSAVSFIEFTPKIGPVGTTVTIYGTGFSATPSQNTVAFNGVTATVTSSTTTRIVTTVPSSATTGTISVTSPGGSANSGQNFVVGASNAPTITGFTPTIAVPGTAVTVSGTNFDSTPSRNHLRFNISGALISSAAPTTISTSVPAATGSGRISVLTQYGRAVSTGDFFIPPPPYGVSDVEFTGRMAIGGGNFTATVNTANKIALVVFDGTGGQNVSLGASGVTISASAVTIYSPAGTILSSKSVGTNGGFIDLMILPMTGTYTILVDPNSTATGSMTLRLAIDSSTLSASPSSVVRGGSIAASWSGIGYPTTSDWIGLYSPLAADSAYINFAYTNSTTGSGSIPYSIPPTLAAGVYQLRLFENGGYTQLATSTPLTVTACTSATVAGSASIAAPGQTVTVSWTGICAPATNDWVGLYAPGASDGPTYVTYQNTNSATANGSMPFTVPSSLAPGNYEWRLYSQGSYARLATVAFSVAKPDLNPTAMTLYKTAWANTAVASSEYSSGGWSAAQTTGAPNVTGCVDSSAAWSPSTSGSGQEWIEVSYATPAPAIGVLIHETQTAGFVTRIDLKDTNDNYTTVWTGTDNTPCGDWFSLSFSPTSYSVKAVKVYTQKAGWEEIDAIGLVLNESPSLSASTESYVAASWNVSNSAGGGAALPSWTDTVYVSTDSVCCTGDTSAGSFTWNSLVQGNGSYNHTKPAKIPALSAGNYYLIIKVDSDNALAESSETNNEYSISFTVSP